jgi:hypothetical protein
MSTEKRTSKPNFPKPPVRKEPTPGTRNIPGPKNPPPPPPKKK